MNFLSPTLVSIFVHKPINSPRVSRVTTSVNVCVCLWMQQSSYDSRQWKLPKLIWARNNREPNQNRIIIERNKTMPRCYILKKHVNQSKSTVKDKPVLGDGNTTQTQCWQPKTPHVALKRHDTPISPTEVYASIRYNNTLENQSGKCFLKFFIFSTAWWILGSYTHV